MNSLEIYIKDDKAIDSEEILIHWFIKIQGDKVEYTTKDNKDFERYEGLTNGSILADGELIKPEIISPDVADFIKQTQEGISAKSQNLLAMYGGANDFIGMSESEANACTVMYLSAATHLQDFIDKYNKQNGVVTASETQEQKL